MMEAVFNCILGDREENRAYRQMMKRVHALPKDYRFAFRKIQKYMYTVGTSSVGMPLFTDLVDFFETSAAEGRQVLEVTGRDVSQFIDEFMRVSAANTEKREKLNHEVWERFHREGQ